MKVKFDFKQLEEFNDRLQDSAELHKHYKMICRELADVLKETIKNNTPVKTGKLKAGWDNQNHKASYTVRKNKNGYSVTLYNNVPYADYVNYGHYSYNQYNKGGEPYVVYNRVKVLFRSDYDDLDIDENRYVFGHFFVEQSIVELESFPAVLEKIAEKELLKWWRWCVNGK